MSAKKKDLLEQLTPKIVKAFKDVPLWGSISFQVILHDGFPVRVISSISESEAIMHEEDDCHVSKNQNAQSWLTA